MNAGDRPGGLDPGLAATLASIRESLEAPGAPAAPAADDARSTPPEPAGTAPGNGARGAPATYPALDEFLADLARPMIAAWLDRHLAPLVQEAVAAEVRRILGPTD